MDDGERKGREERIAPKYRFGYLGAMRVPVTKTSHREGTLEGVGVMWGS